MFYCFKQRIQMKKLYFLIAFSISLISVSQKDYSRYYNSWRLGLNLGGAWQTADYRSCWGMAGGITLEKGFHENATNIFSFAIRGRYLAANTYGMDFNRNYDVKGNDAYNGKYDPNVNFVDSVSFGKQYVYDNYKMKLGEGSLELQVTFNRLRERTHVLFNLWGGIGFTAYQTKSDLLDGSGKMYDFSLVDSTGNKTKALNTYNGLIDKKYESFAYGSKNGNLYTFSPSLGVGLGYQFSPGFSMLWEYKVTFPQGTNADLLDGKLAANGDFFGSNDYYHYTGLNLLFTLRGKKKTKTPKDETVYTNTVVPTQTVVAPTNSVIAPPTNTVVTNTQPTVTAPKPIISFITPPVNGHVVTVAPYKISAQILNVASANQIQFKFNGVAYTNFSFNAQTHILEYNSTLNNGSNAIQIIVTNAGGQDNKSTTVVYDQPKPTVNPPIITYVNPAQPGYVSSTQNYTVQAQVLNVTAQNQIAVYYNGMSTPFIYNATTKQIAFTANLNTGSNAISITASNAGGVDTKTTTVVYNKASAVVNAPIVTYINPAQPGSVSSVQNYTVKAQVLNVTAQKQITVYQNGIAVPFNYNLATKQLEFDANLIVGTNTINVTASNSSGADTKTTTVIYNPPAAVVAPPVVTFVNPTQTGTVVSTLTYTVKAKVLNVTAQNQIAVYFNGTPISFQYNSTTKLVAFIANLNPSSNAISITANNIGGSDTKTTSIVYRELKTAGIPPVVSLINPATTINASDDANYNFKLGVINVSAKSDIEVLFNGVAQTNFNYNTTVKEMFFNTNLIPGNNTLSVKGTNQYGSDIKIITVNYTPHVELKTPPMVNITNPLTTATTSNSNYIFKATVANMPTNVGIVVKYNGVVVTNYSYDGFNVTFNATLVQGNNTFEVTATNVDGTDSKSANVNYKIKAAPVFPIVNLINPASPTNSSNAANYNFKLSVLNVNSNADIEVTFNGVVQNNFTYDVNTKELVFLTTLMVGNNTLIVKGTNQFGNDSKQVTVVYTPKIKLKNPPLITISAPVSGNGSSQTTNYNYQATVANVESASSITAKYNGMVITNFTFDGLNFGYNAILNIGANTLEITATNQDGNDVKTAIVTYKPKAIPKPPVVTILSPTGTPTVAAQQYSFSFKATNVTQNQVQVFLNGVAITPFTFANTAGSFVANLVSGNNTLVVKATNADGTDSKTESIYFKESATTSDTTTPTTVGTTTAAVITGTNNTNQTVVVCHKVPGADPVTRTIPINMLSLHLGHGDTQGACPVKADSVIVNPVKPRTIQLNNNNNNSIEMPDSTQKPTPANTPRRPR
jgi:hypothetical protein